MVRERKLKTAFTVRKIWSHSERFLNDYLIYHLRTCFISIYTLFIKLFFCGFSKHALFMCRFQLFLLLRENNRKIFSSKHLVVLQSQIIEKVFWFRKIWICVWANLFRTVVLHYCIKSILFTATNKSFS